MNSKAISYRILSCLLLALLQYADAKHPNYLESIFESLHRLESMIVKQNTLNALTEQLYSLLLEHQTSSNESNETIPNGSSVEIRKALNLHDLQHLQRKHQRKNRNRYENENDNINKNVNTLNTANWHHRRSFDIDPRLFKDYNQNINSNYNLNKNTEGIFDFSDENNEENNENS